MKGVFLDSQTIDQGDIDFTPLTITLPKWELYPQTAANEIADRIKEAEIVITNKVPLKAESLAQARNLRCICAASTGFDQIDLVTAQAQHITVCNVKGYSTASVIQHTIGLLITLASSLLDYHTRVQEGLWVNAPLFCLQNCKTTELAGKIIGIVGYGAIGQGVASVAQQLGMEVLVAQSIGQSQPNRIPLLDLLPQVDVLSLHCPLTAQTRHLIGAKELALLKPQAIVLNVARGGLIDEAALAQALLKGQLGGAGLDVLSQEPPLADSPLLQQPLPRLLITPHVAWSTYEARKRLLAEIVHNIQAFLAGSPRNNVIQ